MAAKVFATINQKGGVGKTSMTFHLARAAVLTGKKVLLVDVDPQGSLTLLAAAEGAVSAGQVGLADVLSKRAPEVMEDVIVEGVWENLFLVPTTGESLGDVRDELVISGAGRERRLRDALESVKDSYDFIFLDCPPSLDQLTVNALSAADEAIIVTESKLLSAAGLAKILSTIDIVRSSYHPGLQIGAVIMNLHEEHTNSGKHWQGEITEQLGESHPIFVPPVPKAAVINDAAEAATGLDEWGGARATEMSKIFTGYIARLEGSNA